MTQQIQPSTPPQSWPAPPPTPQPPIPHQEGAPQYGPLPYGPPPVPPASYPPPAPPRRRRTGLIIGSIVGAIVVAAGLVVGALVLFGSSSLDTTKLQQEIARLAQDKAGVAATGVSCPDREIKAGDQFTCTAQLDGQPAKFTVKQQDDKGNVHIQLDDSLVVVPKLEDQLSKQAQSDFGFQITSSCDAGGHSVLIDGVGKPVNCTLTDAEDSSNTLKVVATVDDQGQVSYKEA